MSIVYANSEGQQSTAVEPPAPLSEETPRRSKLAPFKSADFRRLYLLNLAEFFGTTLSRLSALQWLFEATGDGRSLGGLGIVTLICQIPSIALGGVLADSFERTLLVSRCQMGCTFVAFTRVLLCAANALSPAFIYITVGLLEILSRLESSARGAMVTAVVPEAELPDAISILQLSQYIGEIVAPFAFWMLADMAASPSSHSSAGGGGADDEPPPPATLTLAFAAAAFSFMPCAVLPRLITADTRPVGGSGVNGSSGRSGGVRGAISHAWLAGLGKMVEGVRYIARHPLLPGLYALDWGFTCVSFYRELFPMWVGTWLTAGVPAGVSARGAVALLVVANFAGGTVGSFSTFALNSYPFKGRLVVYATMGYGVACFAFGCSRQLFFGAAMVFLMGATDAVGATMRKQVVLLSTPDALRGRAQSGHQLAAYVANSIGQIYVAFMAAAVGPGHTMQIGGGITEAMTGLFAWRIPKLLTYRGEGNGADKGACDARGADALASVVSGGAHGGAGSSSAVAAGSSRSTELEAVPADFSELNDAALAARKEALKEAQRDA